MIDVRAAAAIDVAAIPVAWLSSVVLAGTVGCALASLAAKLGPDGYLRPDRNAVDVLGRSGVGNGPSMRPAVCRVDSGQRQSALFMHDQHHPRWLGSCWVEMRFGGMTYCLAVYATLNAPDQVVHHCDVIAFRLVAPQPMKHPAFVTHVPRHFDHPVVVLLAAELPLGPLLVGHVEHVKVVRPS